ncbi:MAG: alanine--tRNA ligase [Promethearchaeota archaeon Loki_b32]|nr:MAG: alanine--tRNA ligase [Candidatus Lokiarchaeota archaeon Loki_b32]
MIIVLSDKEKLEFKDAHTDKELKQNFKKIASRNPDAYFPTTELRELGYMRKNCECCGTYFWTTLKNREVCGDPTCSGGFQVVINNPSKVELSFIGVWEKIVEILEPRGYLPIKRYPCVARWNPTSEFTIASISAFQPYVITGEVEPPAKKLVIPQFCLRFNDIENVGITGSHNTGFVMIGQHSFVSPEEWNQGELFMDIHDFIHKGVGLPKEEITIHEDSWAGGGSFGCSLEFFSRGVELFNQVYTMFEQTPEGPRELKLKVLDMGLGQERVAWFSQGTPNMYEAIFPFVLSKLRVITKIELDLELYNRFSQYSAYLNVDEVDNMDEAWNRVAKELEIGVKELKQKVLPMTALYSIAEHARSLLFAINDGKLPSNVGGGYNLRVIFRRAISFIDKFNWDINMADVCTWHAKELEGIFPEVSEHLDEIREILDVEKEKFYATKKKAGKILEKILKKGEISTETLIELYDSNGISPDMVKTAAKNYGVKVNIPDDFYHLVVERHEINEQIHATIKEIELDLGGIPETKSLYYYDYTEISNKATVLKIIDKMVILDKTVAYPTSGGQLHDVGTINGQKFSDVFKQGNYTVHVLDENLTFNEGDIVNVEVDKNWRTQLSQHHTATHIVNAVARDVLGSHINQAGAKKTLKNSHLDITHYEQIPREKILEIEKRANQIVEKGIDLHLDFIPRTEAEQKYGMAIYQGGAVPGKNLRIVEIPGVDVEACGGTHLNNTSETGYIHITKSQKIQDGIVRLTFVAGEATNKLKEKHKRILDELKRILKVERKQLVNRVVELFEKWKNVNKTLKSGIINERDLQLTSNETFEVDVLSEISQFLSVKKDDVPSKIQKFYSEWAEGIKKIKQMKNLLSDDYIEDLVNNAQTFKHYKLIIESFDGLSQDDLKNFSVRVMKYSNDVIAIFTNKTEKGIMVLGMIGSKPAQESEFNVGTFVKDVVIMFNGKGGGKKDYGQGFINDKEISIDDVKTCIKGKIKNI